MNRRLAGALLVVALLLPSMAAAQPAEQLRIEAVRTNEYPETRVFVSLPAGVAEGSVPDGAFTVYEAGEERTAGVTESRSEDLQILLLMDATGSMGGEPITAAKAAASRFVRQLPGDVSLSVLSYETEAQVITEFSTNKAAHIRGIRSLTAQGETAMYDAVDTAVAQFADDGDARQAIVMLTDGEDNASNISLKKITNRLRESGVTLYAVEFMTAFTDSAALRRMVGATGGAVKEADDSQALLRVYDELATTLVNQYVIEYSSSATGLTELTVELAHGELQATATTTVDFPASVPPPQEPEPAPAPAVLRVEAVNVDAHPQVVVTAEAPRELRDVELDGSAFSLTEGGDERSITVTHERGDLYQLSYASEVSGETEVTVRVARDGITAEDSTVATMPPLPARQGLLGSNLALLVGAALCYVAMALLLIMLLVPRQWRRPRSAMVNALGGQRMAKPSPVAGLADWATETAERQLQRGNRRKSLNDALEQAGINLRPGEFLVLAFCLTLTAAVLGHVLGGLVLGMLFAFGCGLGSRFYLKFKAGRRRSKFANQLSDTLQLLAGSLRAGYSILQAVDAVSREAESPTAEEFRRLVVETRLGRGLIESLEAMRVRVGNDDFGWVVQAIAINREVGGDLAEILDTVGHTIRERNQIRRQVKALSAEGKLSAIVLLALPFCVGGMIMMTNPAYLAVLTTSPIGWGMLFAAAILMAGGTFWLSKIVKFRF